MNLKEKAEKLIALRSLFQGTATKGLQTAGVDRFEYVNAAANHAAEIAEAYLELLEDVHGPKGYITQLNLAEEFNKQQACEIDDLKGVEFTTSE